MTFQPAHPVPADEAALTRKIDTLALRLAAAEGANIALKALIDEQRAHYAKLQTEHAALYRFCQDQHTDAKAGADNALMLYNRIVALEHNVYLLKDALGTILPATHPKLDDTLRAIGDITNPKGIAVHEYFYPLEKPKRADGEASAAARE